MAIVQQISTIPQAGKRGIQARDDFVIAQESFQDHLSDTTVEEMNELGNQINIASQEISVKAEQVANQAVDGGYSQDYINESQFEKYQQYTASGGETYVQVDDNEQVTVYKNSTKLKIGDDYTLNINGTTIDFNITLVANDFIQVWNLKKLISNTNATTIPISKVVAGILALSNTVNTLTATNVTYTGTGATQTIVTGINSCDFTVANNGSGFWLDRSTFSVYADADTGLTSPIASGTCDWKDYDTTSGETPKGVSKVHVKNRTSIFSNIIIDGLRGQGNQIYIDSSGIEDTGVSSVTSFGINNITIGAYDPVNELNSAFILHQELYQNIKWGTTNQGKKYIEAYDAVSNRTMIMYEGSGVAGHEIPHSVGVELDYFDFKNIENTYSWISSNKIGEFLKLNEDFAYSDISSLLFISDKNINAITVGAGLNTNSSSNIHILYGKANSNQWKLVEYTGTGVAGNYIEVGFKPSRIIIKAVDAIGNWVVIDNKRDGTQTLALYLNLSIAEESDRSIRILSSGFDLGSIGTAGNGSGIKYIAIVEADTNSTGGGSYTDLPSLTTNYQGTDLNIAYSDGYSVNGAVNTNELLSGTTAIAPTGLQDGNNYIKRIESTKTYEAVQVEPQFGKAGTRTKALDNPDVYIDGRWYDSVNGDEKVVNGTFDVDISGWTKVGTPQVSYDNGTIKIDCTGLDYNGVVSEFAFPVKKGAKYIVKFTVTNTNNVAQANVYHTTSSSSSSSVSYTSVFAYGSGDGSYIKTVIAEENYMFIKFYNSTTDVIFNVDNISIFETKVQPNKVLPTQTYLDNILEVSNGNLVDTHEWNVPDVVTDDMVVNRGVVDDLKTKTLSVTDGFDLGQKWVNVIAERALDITYINDTGRPIMVSTSTTLNALASTRIGVQVFVDGVDTGGNYYTVDSNSAHYSNSKAIVPSGSSYKASNAGNSTLYNWVELR